MERVALTLVIVGAALAWAYYGPRVLATFRLVQDRRRAQAAQVSHLERLSAGHTRADRAFETIIRELDATDRAWASNVREVSRRARNARNAGRWSNLNRKYKSGGVALPPETLNK